MEILEALQLQALNSVIHPTDAYLLRKVFRWYSEKFHTPLHEVPDLPLDEVLTTYFEALFEKMTTRQRNKIKKDLLMTPEERAAKEKAKAKRKNRAKKPKKVVSDDEFMKMIAENTVGEDEIIAARQKAKEEAAKQMMESLDDHDPLALPEIDSKF